MDETSARGWYAGDAHIHSSMTYNIWEFGPPVDAIASASRAIGLDWVIITDHSDKIRQNSLENCRRI